jgi:hypothetical protein
MKPFRILSEQPDRFIVQNHTGTFAVAKRGLGEAMLARLRAEGQSGAGPLRRFRILSEHPDHFVIQNNSGTSRVFKRGLSPEFIARIRAEGSDPVPAAARPGVPARRLLAETRDHFVLRVGGSVMRVPKAPLTAAQMAQIRSLPWDSVQHFDDGAQVLPDAGTVSAGDSQTADAGTPSQQLESATAVPADSPDASPGNGDAGTASPAIPDAAPTQPADAGTSAGAALLDGKAHPGRKTYQLQLDESEVGAPYQFTDEHGETQCVAFARQASGAPPAVTWLAGQKVWGAPEGSIPRGTMIATIDPKTGRYPAEKARKGQHGIKHVGFFDHQDSKGIHMLGQYEGGEHRVKPQFISLHTKKTGLTADVNAYYVVETEPDVASTTTAGSEAPRAPAVAAVPTGAAVSEKYFVPRFPVPYSDPKYAPRKK